MIYHKEQQKEISFPLGGIGSGCIGLAGNGRLIDWEIYNRPNKGGGNGFSHFAIRATGASGVAVFRVLHGDMPQPWSGLTRPWSGGNYTYGFGADAMSLDGLPHFPETVFKGEFPVAEVTFADDDFPAKVVMTAFNPFIPSNSRDSSSPAAYFEFTITNKGTECYVFDLIGCLGNPFSKVQHRNRTERRNGVSMLRCLDLEHASDAFEFGDLTLATDAERCSFQTYWYRGGWVDFLEAYWHDIQTPGSFRERDYESTAPYSCAHASLGGDTGMLAAEVTLAPGERSTVRFLIAWSFPNQRNYWSPEIDRELAGSGLKNAWKNYYATIWRDSAEVAGWAFSNWTRLREDTFAFRDAFYGSTLPPVLLEAAGASLSTLKSPTVLRLEDGTFYGWEGTGVFAGECEGSCTHVWNYQQALPFLFPDLERSMREANFRYNVDERGESGFRLPLPLGLRRPPQPRSCVDGHFGEVVKAWRDWKISGDGEWLKKLYPKIKKSLEYTWLSDNPNLWDPERTGVISGRQHHTLDMELFGPSSWLNGFYLAALKAGAEMADFMDDTDFASELRSLFERGKAWTEEHLFNGEYFQQQADLKNRSELERYLQFDPAILDRYWSAEHGEIKYQIGSGLVIDAVLPQWFASLYGLGDIFAPEKVRSTLKANVRHGWREHMRDAVNLWRLYSLQEEAGVLMCVWPRGGRPTIPLPYHSETMNGFEHALASHLLRNGMETEALQVASAVRDRHDGVKRNPWNEMEWGSNYARSMAAYAYMLDASGFGFDMRRKHLEFNPPHGGRFFWSIDGAWGIARCLAGGMTLTVLYGSLTLHSLNRTEFAAPLTLKRGDSWTEVQS